LLIHCLVLAGLLLFFQQAAWAMDVTLAWDPNSETDLAGYKVYYATTAGGPYNGSGSSDGGSPIVFLLSGLANPASPEFTVHGLPDGTNYFVVTAYNTGGLESGYSNEVYTQSSTTPPPTPPPGSAPTLSSVEVNGVSGSTPVYTNDPSGRVNIRIVASDDTLVSQYLILDGNSDPNGGTFMGIPGGARQNPIFTVSEFVLNNSDGNHTIYAWVKDDQGAISRALSKTNLILDRVAPTVAIFYNSSSPYKGGDSVTITANFTESNSISGTPTISINYGGTGSDISNAGMTRVSNKQWRYVMTVPSGNDGTATVTIAAVDAAGNTVGSHTGNTFVVGSSGPILVGYATINYTESSVTVTYSESNMRNATLASNYSFNNGLLLAGNGVDTSGTAKTFKFPLNPETLQHYVIYSMQIGSAVTDSVGNVVTPNTVRVNDDDNDGMADDWELRWFGSTTTKDGTAHSDGDPNGLMDVAKYAAARANPQWGVNRWDLSPLKRDSDGDGIPDKYEVDYGLNPVDASDRNLDLDSDGWRNYEEYVAGYSANNANSPVPAPPQVKEVIPAGTGPVPSNSVFAVRLEAPQGINIAESTGVTVTVNDGIRTYKRNLNDKNASNKEIVKAIPLDAGSATSKNLWFVYYRSNETAMSNEYTSGANVSITFEVTDARKDSMTPKTLAFRIQTAAEEQKEAESLPNTITSPNTPGPGLTTSEVTNTATMLDGAAIIYDSAVPANIGIVPYFGPTADIPVFNAEGNTGVGVAMNLLPPALFPSPVTLVIPCPGHTDVSGLYVYYYNGQQWVLACDPFGNVQPGGLGWMVPRSRVNHNGNPAWIEIEVYHFSAVIAATTSGTKMAVATPGTTVTMNSGGGGGGGGCFISSIME
jgi:chitinase